MARSTGVLHGKAFCQIGCNGAGKSASGAVGIGIVDPFSIETSDSAANLYTAGHWHRSPDVRPCRERHSRYSPADASLPPPSSPLSLLIFIPASTSASGMFGVRRSARGIELGFQRFDGIIADELRPAGRYHHRIHHDVFRLIFLYGSSPRSYAMRLR